MNTLRYCALASLVLALASCGEPERPKPAVVAPSGARPGSDFNQSGKVTLYPGESCASQIMFVFHSRSGAISMAAPMRQSKILTDAARDHRTVHVWGKWRRGRAAGCFYVEALRVEVQKSFW